MENEEYSRILSKLSEHEIRIKHLEDMHKSILQIQSSIITMNDRLVRVDSKVESLDRAVSDMKKENRETMQKLVSAVTNGYKEDKKTEAQLRIEKWNAIEKWVIRIILVANTVLLALIGHGVYNL